MSYVKFNHVFTFLLALSAAASFVIPPAYTSKALPQVQSVFAPVSIPARRVGAWFHDRVARPDPRDRRGIEDVRAENVLLRNRLTELEAQLDVERQRNVQWQKLGPLKDRCVAVEVAGGDAGPRDSLALQGSTWERVRDGAVALIPGGVAGQVQGRAGIAGAQLRLITDPGFKVRGSFVRLVPQSSAKGAALGTQPVTRRMLVLEGIGGGAMVVRPPLSMKEVLETGLTDGDIAVADERDWPVELRGHQLGSVTKIEPKRDAPGFAEVRIEPTTNLEGLREVMVLVK